MINEILLALVQAATEFLPISSSGHLALISSLISQPDIFFFTVLNFASLIAVMIFTRKEIYKLITFDKNYRKMWWFVILGTIPAVVFGLFFSTFIKAQFESLLFIGCAFIVTGLVLLTTRHAKINSKIDGHNALTIGIAQMFAVFPGISRSGMTISSARFLGIKPEEAFNFSLLLFIPVSIGAMLFELSEFYFSWSLLVGFVVAFVFSLVFLKLLYDVVRKRKFWMFSFYCFAIGIVSLAIHFF